MPQEELVQNNQSSQVSSPPIQNGSEPSAPIAPGIDNELDSSLENFFNNAEKETKIEEPKKEIVEDKKVSKVEKKEDKKPEIKEASKKEVSADSEKAPKDQAAWTALKNKANSSHKMIEERDAEITRLKQSLAERGTSTNKEVETLKKEIEELNKFRSMVDLQADPEFVSKYDKPIADSVSSIKSMLKDIDSSVTDEILGKMDFSDTKLMDKILDHISTNEDKFKARKLERKIEEFLSLSDKRDETLEEHKGKFKEYIENKKKEGFTKQSEEQGRVTNHIQNLSATKDDNQNPTYPFLSKLELPPEADEVMRNKIGTHNVMVDAMHKKLNEFLSVTSPEQKAEVAVAAVGAHFLNAQLKVALKKTAALEKEIEKLSSVTTEKETPKAKRVPTNNDQDVDSALDSFFNSR